MSLQRRTPLRATTPLKRTTPLARTHTPAKRRPISRASLEQRAKVRGVISIVSGDRPCDPAHVWPRGLGGCDDPLCVVPLTRLEHMAFDAGALDLLPYLIAQGKIAEIQHALGHARGDLIALLHRLTGDRYVPEKAAA